MWPVSVANYGLRARYVTALPEGPLGDAAIGALRAMRVETDSRPAATGPPGHLLRRGRRRAAGLEVVYDRDGAAIAVARPDEFDWEAIFAGARWFHISGITPALSESGAALTEASLRAAKRGRGDDLARPELPRQAVALRQVGAGRDAPAHGARRRRHRQRGGRADVAGPRPPPRTSPPAGSTTRPTRP